jgi:hypothetical protein
MVMQRIMSYLCPLLIVLGLIAGVPGVAAADIQAVGNSVWERSPNDPPAQTPSDLSTEAAWPMAGANPERTSWTPEEVPGSLDPLWYKPFEPYISQKVQIIAAYDTLYVSTAKGLYALDAETGAQRWVYPTALPLGNSPTVADGIVYVGGFDHKLHALDAFTGSKLWTFEAGAGFDTNPVVVDGKVYLGNRDGYFYAVYADGSQAGQLAWKFKTGGPILYSAAYKDGVLYFASNDSHAYALNAADGALVWKSAKLPGAGFHSWWPVIYRDRVIFSGSNNYRTSIKPGPGKQFSRLELEDVYPHHEQDPRGTLVGVSGKEAGDWAPGTTTIDMSRPNVTANGKTTAVTEYFESKPWRRTYFVLRRQNGQEVSYDFDHDGKPEYAPILWVGTHSGNRYPPVVGGDGVLYQSNNYFSDQWIAGGNISGWKLDSPFISLPTGGWNAVDEPQAYSAGGNLIYWNRCCDRIAGSIDLSGAGKGGNYFVYDLTRRLPGYNGRYHNPDNAYTSPYASFGGANGVYGNHGDNNPPIPYKGRIYMHRSNAIIAFAKTKADPIALPMAATVAAPNPELTPSSPDSLKKTLAGEIQKMLDAGHLRPGYVGHGIFDLRGAFQCGDDLVDYWHNSGETIYTLTMAWPYLPASMQEEVRVYLQKELEDYPPYDYNHVGWSDGAPREVFDLPDDVQADLSNQSRRTENYTFRNQGGWGRNPFAFYALWKYADRFGGAKALFDASKNRLEKPPSDAVLKKMPHVHNAYIAGYWGYLELEKLAGYSETGSVRSELDRLLTLRSATFSKDSPYSNDGIGEPTAYCRTLNVANNFMFLVPELAQYLREHALAKVQAAVNEYEQLAPYWFVSLAEEGFGENVLNPLYDAHALFMAKALILQETADNLEPYLDVPAFERGDLFHIQKLVALIENQDYGFELIVSPSTTVIEPTDIAAFRVKVRPTGGFTETVTISIPGNLPDLSPSVSPASVMPPGEATVTLQYVGGGASASTGVWFTIPVTAQGGGITRIGTINLLVGGARIYLPTISGGG